MDINQLRTLFLLVTLYKLSECTSVELGGIVTLSRSYNIRSVLVQSFTNPGHQHDPYHQKR